ncbi:tRNA uridine(34) 5-carboxymethylaminomethyl modification radical SAM/GNAT enzyme Elp3 [Candidatus Falkowbacteria bacterium]|nr:MAG: tRNA uridine(34) 5-carboxymethylaminomethyl modification radical SAM/GNAT enzyme Elp3 [Candidatus Falkowbacteria bacterium]
MNKIEAIKELLTLNIKSRNDLNLAKRRIAKKFSLPIFTNAEILKTYKKLLFAGAIHELPLQVRILRKRAIRTLSGIAPVAVLTKPYPCPGKCVYCPTEKDVPQSYLSNEPAVMRAIRCNYDPYIQVQDRLKALIANGHNPEKIELIVIGGTWSVLPKNYKYWYVANLFAGANEFELKVKSEKLKVNKNQSIAEFKRILLYQQRVNEKAKYKIIGLTLETRPDYIDEKEILEMRELGCTRVEIGVQQIDDKILEINKRGHGVKEIVEATKRLKDYGLKVTYHIMPGLPGSTALKDYKMYQRLFSDEKFQPDQIKFYPTVVTRGSLLYRWWQAGKYKPYPQKSLEDLIVKCKKITPKYVRIIRLIRDIPRESIVAGNRITNLRQVMQKRGAKCVCIRCREARELIIKNYELKIINYKASGGVEYFISYESKDGKTLFGFCRLRLISPKAKQVTPNILKNSALIRELHVYGELVPPGGRKKVQHAGLGKKLMAEAERIAKENGHKKMAVISGIGVRDYYRKLGYRLKDTYMVKNI